MVQVRFFYGRTLPALLVRLRTRRRGQRFRDVPAHVGIVAGRFPIYFEAIVSGVCDRPAGRTSCLSLEIAVPDEAGMVAYLENQVGEPYDWVAIMEDTIGRRLPWETLLNPHRRRAYDCSGLVLDALLVGGVNIPHQALPETPNDLLQALGEVVGVSSYQGPLRPERNRSMFSNLKNWLYNRALRVSHAATVKLAQLTDQKPETIEKLNDAAAGFVINLIPNK